MHSAAEMWKLNILAGMRATDLKIETWNLEQGLVSVLIILTYKLIQVT